VSRPDSGSLPLGTLRAVVTYPHEPGRVDDTAVRAALERVDLGRLVPALDLAERWDRRLALEEQQRPAFSAPTAARAALSRAR
jgi:vitamin B12/bleomycin/antimicrobial peptide transport system ATP-binding/permease protein